MQRESHVLRSSVSRPLGEGSGWWACERKRVRKLDHYMMIPLPEPAYLGNLCGKSIMLLNTQFIQKDKR